MHLRILATEAGAGRPRVRGGEFGMSNRRQFVRSGVALAAAVGFSPRLSALAQSNAATPAATPVVPSDISTLPLKKAGQINIHADKPAYPPFFIDDDPSN